MKRDKKALYNYLKKYHTGSENAVVCKQLQMKFKLSEAVIRDFLISCVNLRKGIE